MTMVRISCYCKFDITQTGVTGHFRPEKLPFKTAFGLEITSRQEWTRARNQQRNFETLLQIVSLRTQIEQITQPVKYNKWWSFEFSVDSLAVYSTNNSSELDILLRDATGVPMLLISESDSSAVKLTVCEGPGTTVKFALK